MTGLDLLLRRTLFLVSTLCACGGDPDATVARSALTATQVTTRAYGQGRYALELDNVKCGWISEVDGGHAVGDVVTETIGGAPLVRCATTRTYQLQAEGCPAAPTLATDAGATAIAGALCAALSTAASPTPAAPIGAIP